METHQRKIGNKYSKTGHYENGEFKNIHVTKMDYTLEQILEVTSSYFSDIQNIPKRPLKIMSLWILYNLDSQNIKTLLFGLVIQYFSSIRWKKYFI